MKLFYLLLVSLTTIAIPSFAQNENTSTQYTEIYILTPEEEKELEEQNTTVQETVKEYQVIDEERNDPMADTLPEEEHIFRATEESPVFPGGQQELATWIASHMVYPETAAEQGIQGRVVVQFIVTKDGEVKRPVILRGQSRELDKEAVRLINSMPKWTPGKNDGIPVNSYMVLPVTFKLSD